MADVPVTEVVNLDAVLDALEDPTSSQVYAAAEAFSPTALAASAAQRAINGGGGGSQPGNMQVKDFLFTEVAVAKMYTATLPVPAGTVVYDVQAWLLASWMASTGWYGIADSDGVYVDSTAHTIGNDQGAYNPLSPTVGTTVYSTFNTDAGLVPNLPLSGTLGGGSGTHTPGRYYVDADMITITVDCTDSDPLGTTGRFLVRIVYATPVTPTPAT